MTADVWILAAVVALIVGGVIIGGLIGHAWGYEEGRDDALKSVDRWHARHEAVQ